MKIIIAGAYAIGTYLARLLSRNNQDIVLMDSDEDRLSKIGGECDLLTIEASPSSIHALKQAGVGKCDLFIGVTPDQSLKMT